MDLSQSVFVAYHGLFDKLIITASLFDELLNSSLNIDLWRNSR